MSQSIRRIWAITRADFFIRFRRPSTAVIFVLACVMAYLWVPDARTGATLMQIAGRRVLYNSAALAMGTAALCNLLFGFVGFYMVSSTIRRDIESRTGFIIASTTMRNWEYLLGKFAGNVFFLSFIAAGFMMSCMVMQLIRGEAPLQPMIFLRDYLVLTTPVVIFVAVIALVFESIRFLSGKFGDVMYFFVWLTMLGVITSISKEGAHPVGVSYFDVWGLAYVIGHVNDIAHTSSVAIGHSPFDASKPPFVFPGLTLTREWLLPRISSALFPIPFLLIALALFHRFNPVKIKSGGQRARRNWITKINALLKPLTILLSRITVSASDHRRAPSLLASAFSDFVLTLQIYPVAALFIVGFAIFSTLTPVDTMRHGILPALFAVFAAVIADLATREKRSGTMSMLYASPILKEKYVLWKFLTGILLAVAFLIVPIIRLALADPAAAAGLAIGGLFTASAAVFLGTVSGNPKTFIVLFLIFWYIVLNSTSNPQFDFAGWYGIAGNTVRLGYLAGAALIIAAAEGYYRLRRKRAW